MKLSIFITFVLCAIGSLAGATTSCQITESTCPNYPTYVGTFSDNYEGSGSNQSDCLVRALQYQTWCDATTAVTANFFTNGVVVASQTAPATTGCRIIESTCPNYPSYVGNFADNNYDGSNSNEAVCLARALQYQTWCGAETAVTAAYSSNGVGLASYTVPAITNTSCQITESACPNYPTYVGSFSDNYEGSGSNQSDCLVRALQYQTWCDTTTAVTANFFSNGVVVASQTAPAISSCSYDSTWTTVDNITNPPSQQEGYMSTGSNNTGFGRDLAGNVYSVGYQDISGYVHWITRKSANNGSTWTTVDDFVYPKMGMTKPYAFGSDSQGNIYVVGAAVNAETMHWLTRKSTNYGATWSTVDDYVSGFAYADGFSADHAGNLYVVGSNGNWITRKSTDGGSTWSNVDSFTSNGNGAIANGVTLDSAGNIYVVGQGFTNSGNSYVTRMSTNGGSTWSTVDNFSLAGFYGEAFGIGSDLAGNTYSVGFAGDSSGLDHYITRKSTNKGSTWITVDNLVNQGAGQYYRSSAYGFGMDASGNIYTTGALITEGSSSSYITRRSTNGGSTWTTVDTVADSYGGYTLGMDLAGNLYTVGDLLDSSNNLHTITRELDCAP
jgi:hypothetical protein